jgi:hypothetical protein
MEVASIDLPAMPVPFVRYLIIAMNAWAIASCGSSTGLHTAGRSGVAGNGDDAGRESGANATGGVDGGAGGTGGIAGGAGGIAGGAGGAGGLNATGGIDGGAGTDGAAGGAICTTTGAGGSATSAGYDGGVVSLRTCCNAFSGAAGSAAGGAGAAAGCPTTDTLPTDPLTLQVYHLVEADLHAKLERMIGRYACGTTPLYRGTFTAHDNVSTVEAGPDGILDGAVIAALAIPSQMIFKSCTTISDAGRELVVIATNGQTAIRLAQVPNDATDTYATLVNHPGSTWSGAAGTCSGCTTDFHTGTPTTIDVSQTTFAGSYCSGGGSLTVAAQGHLSFADQPTIDDIMGINDPSGDQPQPPFTFSQSGTEMVAAYSGTAIEPISLGCWNGCEVITTFHVEIFVNRANPKLLGLRNFRIDPPQTSCCGTTQMCI